jgi:hypothetical protein
VNEEPTLEKRRVIYGLGFELVAAKPLSPYQIYTIFLKISERCYLSSVLHYFRIMTPASTLEYQAMKTDYRIKLFVWVIKVVILSPDLWLYTCNIYWYRDKWVPVTTAWRVLSLRMEERPPILRVAANILHKQSQTADKVLPSAWGVGRGANNSSPLKCILLRNIHTESLGPGLIGIGGRHLWMR